MPAEVAVQCSLSAVFRAPCRTWKGALILREFDSVPRVLVKLHVTSSPLAQRVLWGSIGELLAFIIDSLGTWD